MVPDKPIQVDEPLPTINNCPLLSMYRRPKFLEVLIDIRIAMAEEADHDLAYFVQRLHQEQEVGPDNVQDMTSRDIQQIVIPHEF